MRLVTMQVLCSRGGGGICFLHGHVLVILHALYLAVILYGSWM